jgi:3-deoxy-D-manno-octulosonic-acid transferase
MILLFYNLALLAALVLSAPWWLFRMATTHKYREGLLQRLGWIRRDHRRQALKPDSSLILAHLISFCAQRLGWVREGRGGRFKGQRPRGFVADRPLIWVHAVSVGEVLAVSRLVKTLDAALPEYMIVVSTTTRTGQALARERFGANRVFYCPLDLPWAVRAVLNALQPQMLVLAETEFWPNLLSGCHRRAIPVAVVNARISDRSWPRYRLLRRLWRPLLSRLSRVLAQSQTDADRLTAIGCLPQRVTVAGNLKFDVRAAWEAEATLQLKALAQQLVGKVENPENLPSGAKAHPLFSEFCGTTEVVPFQNTTLTTGCQRLRFVVAGSTLEGEEAALLEAWPRLLQADPQLVLVLAVRHPERFAAVAALLDQSGLAWVRRSEWKGQSAKTFKPLIPGQIVLLDTIGELASVYSLASVAFVGGSLVPAGGHNPLEPAQFGVPIVMGPHYFNFRAITEDLIAHNAICITEKEKLAKVLIDSLCDRTEAIAMGERAKQVFASQAGATGRCVVALKELLAGDSAQ